jgi:hypothetical protein
MTDRPRTLCFGCGQPIESGETDVIEAEEIRPMSGFGEGATDTAPGRRYAFHTECYPHGHPNLRRLDEPDEPGG